VRVPATAPQYWERRVEFNSKQHVAYKILQAENLSLSREEERTESRGKHELFLPPFIK